MLTVSDYIEVARRPKLAARLVRNYAGRFDDSPKTPPVVVWNVCRHCNMTCPHCYAAASDKPSPNTLTTDEALDLLDQMADCGIGVVIFSGGEPLLRPELFDLLERAAKLGISALLSTNGVLIDRPTADRLAAVGVGYVGISIDGLERFNDAYRGLEGGFDRAFAGLDYARQAGLKTGLRITLTTKNRDHLAPLIDRARAASVDRFYVSHLLYSGRAADMMMPAKGQTTSDWRAT